MEQDFLTRIEIKNVRHLNNIDIPLSNTERKNLILTGKNGCGKTSVLEELKNHLNEYFDSGDGETAIAQYHNIYEATKDSKYKEHINQQGTFWISVYETINMEGWQRIGERRLSEIVHNTRILTDSTSDERISNAYHEGKFILAYFSADRVLKVDYTSDINAMKFEKKYEMDTRLSSSLLKYLVNLKTKHAFAVTQRKSDQANEIELWFDNFEKLIRRIMNDPSIKLCFDYDKLQFTIESADKKPFSFNTLSSGYSSVMQIVIELLMRTESNGISFYETQGIVIIDEIETHLHLEMQKNIMSFLTTMFPKVQFIISTHSPFILNSVSNAVVYDLEKRILVENGLENLPYEGIVEGYFNVDTLSQQLRKKFNRYKKLAKKLNKIADDYQEMAELELYLDKIPAYLALDVSTEYKRIKLELIRGKNTDDKSK